MEQEPHPPPTAPSTKAKLAASAGGVVAGAGAVLGSLTHNPETGKSAKRLGVRFGRALAKRLGEKPRQE